MQVVVERFQFIIITIKQCRWTCELRRIIVPVTCNLLQFQFEVSTLPEVKGIDGFIIIKLRLHSTHNLVKDFLTKLVEEDFTFVLRIGRVFYNVDVCVVRQFTLFAYVLLPYLHHYQSSREHGSFHKQDRFHR